VVLGRAALPFEVGEGLDEETAGAAGGVEHGLAEPRGGDLDHEADHRPRRVELARVAGGIAHFLEHRLVELAQGVDFGRRLEVDGVDLVDHAAQQVAVDHAVRDAAKDAGDHVAAVLAAGAAQRAQIGEQAGAAGAVRPHGALLLEEGEEVLAGQVGLARGPVAPAVGRLDGRAVRRAGAGGLFLADPFGVVQELEEQDPGEHGQAVELAAQPLVLAHDVARGLDQSAELPRAGGQIRALAAVRVSAHALLTGRTPVLVDRWIFEVRRTSGCARRKTGAAAQILCCQEITGDERLQKSRWQSVSTTRFRFQSGRLGTGPDAARKKEGKAFVSED
jgi:hypothetical protein